MGKSSVYFGGVNQDVKQQILNYLGFVQGELPFKYLGIPLSYKKIALIQWQPLIDRITGKISSWTAKKLSYMIDAMCRSCIWSGSNTITRKSYVAWDKMCTPKSTGGTNIINLMIWNKAAIAKNYGVKYGNGFRKIKEATTIDNIIFNGSSRKQKGNRARPISAY
uniref:Uncharacterized protein LOC104224858 n=1 Tax=Nicotiana sylvestris TaxID=4096 RepID=A0A1U7WCB4_NICSY|nr:PREDICTED: uncharacterized protein LOC104224858 [Nicotiana sylvestris]